MSETKKECIEKKQYIPHKLRSHPFRCIVLPLICGLFFISYWFMLCPLLFVSYFKDIPLLFWSIALLVYIILMAIAIFIWRCLGRKDRKQEIVARKQEYDSLLSPEKSNVKQLYHVTLINDTSPDKKSHESNTHDSTTNLNKDNNIKSENVENSEKAFPKCSVKRKPELMLQKSNERPLSVVSTASSPKSPLTPRELFFIDLIEAANNSPASYIPATQEFLDMERKNCLPDMDDKTKRQPTKSEIQNSEFFIASVPNQRSTTTQVFMYIASGEPEKEFKVTMCESDDVFVD